jgi:hypothetical protein
MTAHDVAIRQTAQRYELDAELLIAQVLIESSGKADAFRFEPAYYERYIRTNPHARGARYGPLAACSYGLLQIMLETACELGFQGLPWQLFDPAIGLDWGAKYLRTLYDTCGKDMERALVAYNGGLGAALKKPYRTQAYADQVFAQRDASA